MNSAQGANQKPSYMYDGKRAVEKQKIKKKLQETTDKAKRLEKRLAQIESKTTNKKLTK